MFISDMGAILRPTHGFNSASNFPFRDGAPSMYEGSIRVPAMFRWPGKIKAGVESKAVLSHLNVLPMCLNAAGVAAPEGRIIDGRDPLAALNDGPSPHPFIVNQLGGAIALREGRRKILRSAVNTPWELYDLETNAIESFNLAAKRPKDLERVVALHAQWEQDVKHDASVPERYVQGKK